MRPGCSSGLRTPGRADAIQTVTASCSDAWSRGVGRALLERAEEELASAWDEAVLWTLRDNPRTRRFYELAGWKDDGEQDSFERLGGSAGIVRCRKRLSRPASRV